MIPHSPPSRLYPDVRLLNSSFLDHSIKHCSPLLHGPNPPHSEFSSEHFLPFNLLRNSLDLMFTTGLLSVSSPSMSALRGQGLECVCSLFCSHGATPCA